MKKYRSIKDEYKIYKETLNAKALDRGYILATVINAEDATQEIWTYYKGNLGLELKLNMKTGTFQLKAEIKSSASKLELNIEELNAFMNDNLFNKTQRNIEWLIKQLK